MIAQILVADDNTDLTCLLNDFLTGKGNRVIVVNDGFQMAQKASEHLPHLIIADIQMPGAYGSSAYQVLQKDERTKKIPVIFISAHPFEKLAKLLPQPDSKTRFVRKPIDLDTLYEMILELLPLGGYCP
jgi:CheY-like chemotaxis protein